MTHPARRHNELVDSILSRFGREPDVTLWRNAKSAVVRGVPRALPGLGVGSSDLIGVLAPSGRMLAIEVKTGGAVESPRQHAFAELVRRRGGFATVVHSVEEFGDALARARTGASS